MERKCKGLNKMQHFFIWIGIVLFTFMAIAIDSTLFWLVATVGLISESVWLCKDEPLSERKKTLLILSVLIFTILFIYKDDIRRELGFRRHASARPIIRK